MKTDNKNQPEKNEEELESCPSIIDDIYQFMDAVFYGDIQATVADRIEAAKWLFDYLTEDDSSNLH